MSTRRADDRLGDMRIAGRRTCVEWREVSARLEHADLLTPRERARVWRDARAFVEERFRTRFVDPLDALSTLPYAGFLVVAVTSLLIEALQRVCEGRRLEEHASGELVTKFLRTADRFGGIFRSFEHKDRYKKTCPCIACDFYGSVRSGIVHEGEAQNGWLIRQGQRHLLRVDGESKVLDRDRFYAVVRDEFQAYLEALGQPGTESDRLRTNLRNTLDAVCSPPPAAPLTTVAASTGAQSGGSQIARLSGSSDGTRETRTAPLSRPLASRRREPAPGA